MQLVINTFGASIRKEGELFHVLVGDKTFDMSAHKVQSILITTGAHFSTDAIQLAVDNNIDVIFLDRYGDPFGRVWHCKMGSTAAIRRQQIEAASSEDGLKFVIEWTTSKVRSQREFLKQLQKRRPQRTEEFESPLTTLTETEAKLQALEGALDEKRKRIMGYEGTCGRVYFGVLSGLMPEAFRFEGRSRNPAKDEFNAMLNYAYGVFYSLVEKACIIAGLDPFVGFLHTDNYNKKSLVFDLIEPFRIIADRTVVHLFTGRNVKKEHFEPVRNGLSLNGDGKALLIGKLNENLEKTVRHPTSTGRSRNIKQRDVIQYEAHSLANALLGKDDIPRIVETEALLSEEEPDS